PGRGGGVWGGRVGVAEGGAGGGGAGGGGGGGGGGGRGGGGDQGPGGGAARGGGGGVVPGGVEAAAAPAVVVVFDRADQGFPDAGPLADLAHRQAGPVARLRQVFANAHAAPPPPGLHCARQDYGRLPPIIALCDRFATPEILPPAGLRRDPAHSVGTRPSCLSQSR